MNFDVWIKGLVAAIVGGVANSTTMMIVDPATFNIYEGGSKLVTLAVTSAVFSAAFYLAKSPLPESN